MHIIWFVLSFIFIFLEVGHPGLFYFLALSFGSFSACIASYLQYSTYTQSIIFLYDDIFVYSDIASFC